MDNFPEKDEYRLVCVPGSDVFGVSDAVQELGSHSESTELYSSHAFLELEATLSARTKLQDKAKKLHFALKNMLP